MFLYKQTSMLVPGSVSLRPRFEDLNMLKEDERSRSVRILSTSCACSSVGSIMRHGFTESKSIDGMCVFST